MHLVDGRRGELTVLMDGAIIAQKWLFFKPSISKVIAIVRERQPAEANSNGQKAAAR